MNDEHLNEIELLKNQVELWKSKYRSQTSRMGAYKTKIQKEVKEREDAVEWKEKAIERDKKFLEENNFEDLEKEYNKIYELKRKVEHYDYENRKQLEDDFKDIKNKIIDELSKELIRWTEENDIDNQRSQGYLIGINKAKKIIKENFVFELKTRPLSLQGMLEKIGLN